MSKVMLMILFYGKVGSFRIVDFSKMYQLFERLGPSYLKYES